LFQYLVNLFDLLKVESQSLFFPLYSCRQAAFKNTFKKKKSRTVMHLRLWHRARFQHRLRRVNWPISSTDLTCLESDNVRQGVKAQSD